MSQPKQASKQKRRACAVPLLGAAGLSLSLASGASAVPAAPTKDINTGNYDVTLGEEEISDVTLATFYVFDKENVGEPESSVLLVGHRGCGGCRGCHARGCGGCHAHGCRGCHRGCGGCHRGCGGWGGCIGIGIACGGCGGGGYWCWRNGVRVWCYY
jgi:hypothetical protein